MSKLYFRYSTMAAGKSLDLLKVAYNYEERNKKVILLTSEIDDRFEVGRITSRVGLSKEANTYNTETNLFELIKSMCDGCDCVLIDESQFLTKEQVWELTDVVDDLGCNVICYGLRTDFKGEPFEGSTYLMSLSDKIEELKTICEFGDKATMNMRLINQTPVFDGDSIQIGGNESYMPVCRKYFKEMKKISHV